MLVIAAVTLLAAPQADSAALLRRAHRAQSDFEWRRQVGLPLGSAGSSGECDAVIGRFCYWHDPDASPPPEEVPEITAARDRLIAFLTAVAESLPGDGWIAGQRVRYLLEAGRPAAARRAARFCRAARWWCEALEGLARHVAGEYAEADSVFQLALGDMGQRQRCRWTDLSALVDGPLRRRYRQLGCEERRAINARIWWLGRPLFSTAANDRRTEHFARLTMAATWRDARTPYGLANADDLTELTERYGWPVAWAQSMSASTLGAPRTVIGSEREPSFHFLPESLAVPGALELDDAPRARARYAPAYADTFVFFTPQIAAFQRGDSTLVVARYDLTRDTLFRGRTPEVALVLARNAGSGLVVTHLLALSDSGLLVARAPWSPRLVSLEIAARAARRMARGRVALRSLRPEHGGLVVSDLLPFEPRDSLPAGLEAVLERVVSLRERPRGSRVGFYWEVYGVGAAGETLATSVSVEPTHTGWLRSAIGALGLARRPRRVQIDWREAVVPRRGVAARALVVDLSTLSPGEYRIEVRVHDASGTTAAAARTMRIVPG